MKTGKEKTTPTDNGQFIRLFNNVRRHKEIQPLDKMILSHIISYQLQGKEFFMSNDGIAYEYGTSKSTAQRAIKRLEKYLNKRNIKIPSKDGGRLTPRRYLTVKNLSMWTSAPINIKPMDFTQFKTLNEFLDWAGTNIGNDRIEQFLLENETALKYLETLKG